MWLRVTTVFSDLELVPSTFGDTAQIHEAVYPYSCYFGVGCKAIRLFASPRTG